MSLPVIAAGAAWVEQLPCVAWIPGTRSSVLVWGGGGGGGGWVVEAGVILPRCSSFSNLFCASWRG